MRTKPQAEGGSAERQKEPGSLVTSLSRRGHPDRPPPFSLWDGPTITGEHKLTLSWFKPLTAECPDTPGGRKEGGRREGRRMRSPGSHKTKDSPGWRAERAMSWFRWENQRDARPRRRKGV